ncbi:TPA: hypothetical protein ACITS4_004925, partial [Salmonella enterica subsp. enterica serovar Birkenhead]
NAMINNQGIKEIFMSAKEKNKTLQSGIFTPLHKRIYIMAGVSCLRQTRGWRFCREKFCF